MIASVWDAVVPASEAAGLPTPNHPEAAAAAGVAAGGGVAARPGGEGGETAEGGGAAATADAVAAPRGGVGRRPVRGKATSVNDGYLPVNEEGTATGGPGAAAEGNGALELRLTSPRYGISEFQPRNLEL